MPDARDWVVRGAGVATRELAGGFFIQRGVSPMPAARSGRFLSRRVGDGKENIRPRAVTRSSKSPLPEWHPRTPLRDITVIVSALGRRRSPLRAPQVQRRDHDREATPQSTLPRNPLPLEPSISELTPQEPNASDHTPVNQFLPSDPSEPSTISTVTSFTPPQVEHPLLTSSSSSLTPVEHPPLSVSITTNLASNDSNPSEDEKNPSSSIEHPLQISSSSSSLFPAEHPLHTVCVSPNLAPDGSKPTEYEKQQSGPMEHPSQTAPFPVSLSSDEHPLLTVCVSTDHAPQDSKQAEYEKKLSSSIDEIERVVMKNLKRTPKVPARKITRKSTLMSLR
ncbi:extensin [Cocos nucifera]|nr:extensin [Cocos nucifera]